MPSTIAYYVQNLDRHIFQLWGYGPRWYGLAYLVGFLGAYLLVKKQARDGMLRLKPAVVPDLVLNCCIFGVLIGGRLGFCLFYEPWLLGFNGTFPYWGVLKVWDGGMASHGGIVFTILTLAVFAWYQYGKPTRAQVTLLVGGTFVAGFVGWAAAYLLYHSPDPDPQRAFDQQLSVRAAASMVLGMAWLVFYSWRKAIPMTNLGDASSMVVPIGLFFGRCANFINGELYGHPTEVPWGVKFPTEVISPTNGVIDPAVGDKLPQVFHQLHLTLDWSRPDEIMQQGLKQLNELLLKHDPQAVQAVADIIRARHPSQLYEALLEGALLFIICYVIGRKWKKDGMASGAFLTFYPIMRIIGEQFRVGDAPMDFFGVQISQGILYSVPMVVAGILYWGYWIWRDRPAVWVPAKEDVPHDQPRAEK
jgi:phosphatidylglycerol---prolipoprotein diacylglyceryl transferase